MAAVSSDGHLIGVASCRPPIVDQVLFPALEAFSPPPRMVTYCQSIWKTATLGEERAIKLMRQMATVWMRIAARLPKGYRQPSQTAT